MENKFESGEIVRTKVNPDQNLTIRHYVDGIYYCTAQGDPAIEEGVYFERELIPFDKQNIELLSSLNLIINKWNDCDEIILVKQ